jgi:methyl-accepting chemotaxis protein
VRQRATAVRPGAACGAAVERIREAPPASHAGRPALVRIVLVRAGPLTSKEDRMNASTIALVRDSWRQVLPIADDAGRLFYANLFQADPTLRPLFHGDLARQAGKLMQMIDVAVNKLDTPDVLLPVLERLGARHIEYGVRREHYATVGAALVKTLAQGLGETFTPQVKRAWIEAYATMADAMVRASAAHPAG